MDIVKSKKFVMVVTQCMVESGTDCAAKKVSGWFDLGGG